jgi:hypothetical protein
MSRTFVTVGVGRLAAVGTGFAGRRSWPVDVQAITATTSAATTSVEIAFLPRRLRGPDGVESPV